MNKISMILAMLGLIIVAPKANTQDSLFAPPVNYGVEDNPISVFASDFNGDGYIDLAVANDGSGSVSVMFNNGYGIFQTHISYWVGDGCYAVFGSDFDGDGYVDLACVDDISDSIYILFNNGDGTFESAGNYGVGGAPSSVFGSDFDGDEYIDLAVGNWASNNVTILFNNGDGTFETGGYYEVGNNPLSIFASDFDIDGSTDLVVTNYNSHNVSILLNNGDGIFQIAVNYGVGNYPSSVFSCDLDGDNDNDLAVANYSNNVSILFNNGDGTFQTSVNYGAGAQPRSVFASDFDIDGFIDLAVANSYSDNVSILLNNDDGTFQPPANYEAGDGPLSVFGSDFDNDGDIDLAAANYYSNSISTLTNMSIVLNHPPVLDSIGPKAVNEGENLNIPVSATDPDGTTAFLATSGLPGGSSFTDYGNGTGVFDWTPDSTQSGIYTVTFYAIDQFYAYDSEVVQITVYDVDRLPDLVVTNEGITLLPAFPHDQQGVQLYIRVNNSGFAAVGSFQIQIAIEPSYTGIIADSIIADGLEAGSDKTYEFSWIADAAVDTLYLRVDPLDLIDEESEENNSAKFPVSVINPDYVNTYIWPFMQLAELKDTATYYIVTTNQTSDKHSFSYNLTGLGQFDYILEKDSINLLPGQYGYNKLYVYTSYDCLGDTGTYSFLAEVNAVDTTGLNSSGGAQLIVSETSQITNILPEDGQSLASNSATFMWTTRTEATSEVFYKKLSDTEYTRAIGQSGKNHVVYVSDLDYNEYYNWHIRSENSCGEQLSDEFTFYTNKGVVFDSRDYGYSIRRSYGQEGYVSVTNNDSQTHEILVEIINPCEDLIAGFVGDGSMDQVLSLAPGNSAGIDLSFHAQDVEDTIYNIAFRLTSTSPDDDKIYDYANAYVYIQWPDTNFVLIDMGLDPSTLTRSMRLQNYGDTVSDFNVIVEDMVGIYYFMMPQIDHALLGPNEYIDFDLIPTFQDTVSGKASCAATVIATGAGKEVTHELTDCCEKDIFLVERSDVIACSDQSVRVGYCTNATSFSVNMQIPPLESGQTNIAYLSVNFIPWSGVKPHTIKIYLNGHLVGTIPNTVPEGPYEFEFDPSFLIISPTSPSINRIRVVNFGMNRGHRHIAAEFSICLCLSSISEYICATDETEALDIINNRPYLHDGSPNSISIVSPEDGSNIPRWVGTRLEADVQPLFHRYNVWADISYPGGGNQVVDMEYDDNNDVYYVNWLPNACEDNVSVTINAQGCTDPISDNITVNIIDCEVSNIDLEVVQLYFTNISTFWPENYTVQYPRGDTQYVGMVVKNNGETIATNVKIEFRLNDNHLGSYIFPEVKKDTFYLADTAWYLDNPITENANIEGIIDPDYEIADNNRANNSKSEYINIYYASSATDSRPFDLRTDAYSFPNWRFNYEGFQAWFELLQEHPCYTTNHDPIILLLKGILWWWTEHGGHCFGMSNTTSLYFEDPNYKPNQELSVFEYDRGIAEQDILEYQHYMYVGALKSIFWSSAGVFIDQDPLDQFSKLKGIIKDDNQPAVILLFTGQQLAHAVNAYKIIEFQNGQKVVNIYENNDGLLNSDESYKHTVSNVAIYYEQSGTNKFQYGATFKNGRTKEFLDVNYFLNNEEYAGYYPRGFPYMVAGSYYEDAFVRKNVKEHCDYLTSALKDFFNRYFSFLDTMRKKAISIWGKTKSFIKDKAGNISGFFEQIDWPKGGDAERYSFLNEIPGCVIDTTSATMIFYVPDSIEYELFLFGDSLDTAVVNCIDPSNDSGRYLRFIQYQSVPVSNNQCSYLNLYDSATTYPIQTDNDCDQQIDEYIEPDTLIKYLYGDANNNGTHNILDITYLINYLYKGGEPPFPIILGDADCNGANNLLDITYLIAYLYKGGNEPGCLD